MAFRKLGERAIVLGASIAGLFAARALSDFFERVVILERERLPDGSAARKGVPQGLHIHAILPPVYESLKHLMPEVIDDLVACGAHLFDGGDAMKWHLGDWLAQGETGQTFIAATRPLFESRLRRHVEALHNVEIRQRVRFTDWTLDHPGGRITEVVARSKDETLRLSCDLAVDARGSGSTLPRELIALGFETPKTELVSVDLSYTSCLFEIPDAALPWSVLMINPTAPGQWTGGVAERVEGGRFLVTLWGYFGDRAPAEPDGFRRFARSLAVPDIADLLAGATPVSEYRRFRIPKNRWHRYDRLKRFPDRLLVVGDAFCKLNPIYGQGMTKAAKEGLFLWDSLRRCRSVTDLSGVSERFRRTSGSVGASWAWELTSSADLAYPQSEGKRPLALRVNNWYMNRLFAAACNQLEIRKHLIATLALLQPPTSLLRPRIVWRVLGR